jgi:hypothetical protein
VKTIHDAYIPSSASVYIRRLKQIEMSNKHITLVGCHNLQPHHMPLSDITTQFRAVSNIIVFSSFNDNYHYQSTENLVMKVLIRKCG